jgi:hypothetical protein
MKSASSPVLRRRLWLCAAAAFLLTGLATTRVEAALGEDVSSIATLQARLKASLQVHRRSRYTIHELALPTGANVRELVGDAGKVFAVAWSGGFRPNLRDLMGAHYDRFIAATRGRRARRGIVRIELPGMVVVMGGYLRTFFGQVTLTDLVPAGLSLEDLR